MQLTEAAHADNAIPSSCIQLNSPIQLLSNTNARLWFPNKPYMQNNETLSLTWVIAGLRRPRRLKQCWKHLDIKHLEIICWKRKHTIRNETAQGSHRKMRLYKQRELTKNTCSFSVKSHCFVQSHTWKSHNGKWLACEYLSLRCWGRQRVLPPLLYLCAVNPRFNAEAKQLDNHHPHHHPI